MKSFGEKSDNKVSACWLDLINKNESKMKLSEGSLNLRQGF